MTTALDETATVPALTPSASRRAISLRDGGLLLARRTVQYLAALALRVLILVATRPTTAALCVGACLLSPYGDWRAVLSVTGVGAAAIAFTPAARRQLVPSLAGANAYRRRRRRVRRRWVTAMTDAGLAKAQPGHADRKRVPRLVRLSPTAVGVRVVLDGSPVGAGLDQLTIAAGRLTTAFGARDMALSSTPSTSRRLARSTVETHIVMDLIYADAFRRVVVPEMLPKATKPLHVVVGLDAYGDPIEKDLRLPTLLVGGQGAGKSSEAWRVLQGLLEAGIPFRLRVFDPKGGQEFHLLRDVAYLYESDPSKWPRFMELALGALHVQQGLLAARDLLESPFTRGDPLDIMIIDELVTATLLSDGKTQINVNGRRVALSKALPVYLSQCRSAGATVIALSQLSQKEVLGAARDLFGYVACGRVGSDDVVRSLGFDPARFPAHQLAPGVATAGVMWTTLPAGPIVKYRGAWVSPEERARVARAIKVSQDYYRSLTGRSGNGAD